MLKSGTLLFLERFRVILLSKYVQKAESPAKNRSWLSIQVEHKANESLPPSGYIIICHRIIVYLM